MNPNRRIASEDRTPKWDNLKFAMILCVVIGHTLYYFYSSSAIAKSLYLFLYTFHMPVFVFISGLFSKRKIQEKRYEVILQYLLIYSVMKLLDAIGSSLTGGKIEFHFFWSDGPEWYALAMAVFYFVTMLIKDYNKLYMFLLVFLIGCIGGLDSHMGNHYASMRICTFYPVFLAGFYLDRSNFELTGNEKQPALPIRLLLKLASLILLVTCFVVCVLRRETLWPYKDFFKAKVDFMQLKINGAALGIAGVPLRFACYLLWAVLIFAVITLCSEREHIWTWLGQRTQSTFIWHKFILVMLLQFFGGKAFLMTHVPNYYVPAALCIAVIVTIASAYLPPFNIGKKLRQDMTELPFVAAVRHVFPTSESHSVDRDLVHADAVTDEVKCEEPVQKADRGQGE